MIVVFENFETLKIWKKLAEMSEIWLGDQRVTASSINCTDEKTIENYVKNSFNASNWKLEFRFLELGSQAVWVIRKLSNFDLHSQMA